MSKEAWGRLGLTSWGYPTAPHLSSHIGGCFLAMMPLWVSTSHLSNRLMFPRQRRISQGGPKSKGSDISVFTSLISMWDRSRVMGYQREARSPPRPSAHPLLSTPAGEMGPSQAGGGRVTLGRIIGAWTEAGRYYAQKATAEDTNLNRQGINGNFYLGRKSIEISR